MKRALMLIALLASPAANATWITLEPDDVAAGTNVSNYWDGVSMRGVAYQGAGIYNMAQITSEAGDPNRTPTGERVFRSTLPGYFGDISNPSCVLTFRLCGSPWSALRVEFSEAVRDVSVLTFFGLDGISLWLYDVDYNLVGSCHSTFGYLSQPCYQLQHSDDYPYSGTYRLSAFSENHDIKYAVIGGLAVGGNIDAISYSVPEPGALGLFSVGLIGLALRRPRRLRSSAQTRPWIECTRQY